MSDPATPNRLFLLRELADSCLEVYDQDALDALQSGNVPRYALLTSEGSAQSSYAENPNLTVHATLDAMATAAAHEYKEGWCSRTMMDLDTGLELDWRIAVVIVSDAA
jgi:hypothetical protein